MLITVKSTIMYINIQFLLFICCHIQLFCNLISFSRIYVKNMY